jgi:lipoyl(octanoyl) transferase
LGAIQPFVDLAWAAALLRAQSGLRQLRNPDALPATGGEMKYGVPPSAGKGSANAMSIEISNPSEIKDTPPPGGGTPNPEQVWFLLRSGVGEAAHNMALDEALLEAAPSLGGPVLRFYSWRDAAASFGYFQKYADIEKLTQLRPLVRRPTGGGLVPHDADWTYSVVAPPGAPWYALKAVESYQRVHEWIKSAFGRLGVATELAPCCRKALPGQCFAGYEKSDVLWQGKKIAGAAQRRNRHGLLIQGSVQPPPVKVARADWEEAMCEAARREFGVEWKKLESAPAFGARVGELAAGTYAQTDYNCRR